MVAWIDRRDGRTAAHDGRPSGQKHTPADYTCRATLPCRQNRTAWPSARNGTHTASISSKYPENGRSPTIHADLYGYGLRFYQPKVGRWVGRDGITEEGGLNLYGCVFNNPLVYVDPVGLTLYAFDGTGTRNETWTHVSILRRAYRGDAFYAEGVGSRWYSGFFGGVFGLGGRARVNEMYLNLVNTYQKDKNIDIIGFSRGASLAREFANMIHEQGIVDPQDDTIIECDPDIRFVGLFDTVGSFGIPGNDINIGIRMGLPSNVKNAAQAIAQDERRAAFPLTPLNSAVAGQRFSQQVFQGDHSDIGGGHEEEQNVLALAPLQYVHSRGVSSGVPFGPLELRTEESGIYLVVGGERRPWAYQQSLDPHDLTRLWYYADGGPRQNLPANAEGGI